ncbi:MAG: spore germination protein, partial [Eubacterium sp.]|nr:spore germination protein [Eubacterium sp.]
ILTQAKRDKIAPISIFFLLFISRIVVSLTNVQSVTTGLMQTDILISVLASMGLTLIFSLPAIYCYKKHKSPFDVKWVGFFYSLYFIYLAGVNISRFSYFASTTINPNSQGWIYSVVVAVCAFYGAYLGIEALSRFSAFIFVLLFGSILVALFCNLKNYQEINLYPVITNNTNDILKNIVFMTSSSSEMVIFLCLSKKVNGKAVKPFVWSVIATFFMIFLLLLFVVAIMGDAASLQAFPLYTMFQLAKIGIFERIDVLYISFWIFGVFIKAVLLIYCAGIAFKPMKKSIKNAVSAMIALVVAVCLTEFVQVNNISPVVYAIPFSLFCIVIPVLTLIFKKRNFGDELVEKF